MKKNNTVTLTDKNGEKRTYEIINREYSDNMKENADTPDAAIAWLAVGEFAGHLKRI
jgi:hypothetical protein